jgi:hypothetical protein
VFKKLIGYLLTGVLSALAAIASTVAILGYKAPASFPIVKGINIPGCYDVDEGDAELPGQDRFLHDLEKYNRQVVFIDQFSIMVGACTEYDPKTKKDRDKFKEHYSNKYFSYERNTLRYDSNANIIGGAVTVGFKKAFGGAGYNVMLLTVIAPEKDHYFSDPNCNENCYGAQGLYTVSVSSNEGLIVNKLEPFPATSGLIDAYQCTLAKLNAKTTWEKFSACRF